jgi:hypothetical protein
MRFSHFEVWGTDQVNTLSKGSTLLTLTLQPSGWVLAGMEGVRFTDMGTSGNRRPHIAVRLPTLASSSWIDADNGGTALVTVNGAPNSTVVLQFTVELRTREL